MRPAPRRMWSVGVFAIALLAWTGSAAAQTDRERLEALRAESLHGFWAEPEATAADPAPHRPQPGFVDAPEGADDWSHGWERLRAQRDGARADDDADDDDAPPPTLAERLVEVAPAERDASAEGRRAPADDSFGDLGAWSGRGTHPAVDAARQYLGVPYVFGGTNPAVGLDCSAFVQRAYADVGVALPRVVAGQMHVGTEVPSLDLAQPGDLIVWCRVFAGAMNCTGAAGHIGIYLGGGRVIHAGNPVHEAPVSAIRTRDPIVTIRRVL